MVEKSNCPYGKDIYHILIDSRYVSDRKNAFTAALT